MRNLSPAVFASCLIISNTFAADVVTEVAPPAPRIERAPPPRDGYIWGPGHWEWSGHAYYWANGSWVVEHRGAHFVADRWDQSGTQWRFVKGHWER